VISFATQEDVVRLALPSRQPPRAIALEGSFSEFCLSSDSLERVRNALVSFVGQQGAERQETDVLADHAGRAVAHGNSGHSGMEAVSVVPLPLVCAIDDAGDAIRSVRSKVGSRKTGPSHILLAIIQTGPAAARVAGPKSSGWPTA